MLDLRLLMPIRRDAEPPPAKRARAPRRSPAVSKSERLKARHSQIRIAFELRALLCLWIARTELDTGTGSRAALDQAEQEVREHARPELLRLLGLDTPLAEVDPWRDDLIDGPIDATDREPVGSSSPNCWEPRR